MNNIRMPYKISLEDTNVSYFEISTSWGVSNPNPYPVYIDTDFRLIHRGGGYSFWERAWVKRITDATSARPGEIVERVWYWYQPLRGVKIDFSQHIFLHSPYENMGTERVLQTYVGYGEFGEMYQVEQEDTYVDLFYIEVPRDFAISPNVRSELKSLQLLPPKFRGSYTATLRIPGPEASLGMTKFWNSQDSPDFDIEVRPVVYPYWDHSEGTPSATRGAEEPIVLRKARLKNAFELDVKKGRQQARKSDSYDVDWYRGD